MSKTLSQIATALETDKTAIRNAILSGGGTCPEGNGFDDFATDIATIPTGTPGAVADVNIYDYDGTIIASYTKQQFLALSDYPTHPDRTSEGLTSDGWTHTFEEAQAYVEECGMLEIGALYYVTSGKFEIRIHIPEEANTIDLRAIGFYVYCENGYIYWGDGSSTSVGSSWSSREHYYSHTGDYTITFSSSKLFQFGSGGGNAFSGASNSKIPYQTMRFIKAIYISPQSDFTYGNLYFNSGYGIPVLLSTDLTSAPDLSGASIMRHLNIPNTLSYISGNTNCCLNTVAAKSLSRGPLSNCKRITLDKPYVSTASSISSNLQNVYTEKLIFPKPTSTTTLTFNFQCFVNLEEIDLSDFDIFINYQYCLYNCYNLKRIVFGHFSSAISASFVTIPNTVEEIKFIDSTPPTNINRLLRYTSGGSVAYYLPPRILIPSGSLSDYMTATGLDAMYFTEY